MPTPLLPVWLAPECFPLVPSAVFASQSFLSSCTTESKDFLSALIFNASNPVRTLGKTFPRVFLERKGC